MSSAIAVLLHWDGSPVEQQVLEAANRSVHTRFPHGQWVWAEGSVGMAQADLATLPEDEPGMAPGTATLHIVSSCRLDNRVELRQTLATALPSAQSDAALILAAYQAWGERCVERLLGDFAFVIWDQAQRRLFAARDLSGSRPLFYYADANRLFVASEHTQILQDPTIPLVVDPEQVAEYFTPSFQWSSGWDQGMLRGFLALPAGATLTAQAGKIQVQPYWQWHSENYAHCSEMELLDEYLYLLQQALQCRLRSRHPVGFELSGGLDSTALVCLGARRLASANQELATFSLIFDETPAVNERRHIQTTLDSLSNHATAARPQAHFLNADSLFAPACLSPTWEPSSITAPQTLTLTTAHAQLYAMAAQAGCGVLLSGEMGDALNDGFPVIYFDLLRRGDLAEVGRRLRRDWGRSRRRAVCDFARHLLRLVTPLSWLRQGVQLCERWQSVEIPLPTLLTPHFRQQVVARERAYRQQQATQMTVRSPAIHELLTTMLPPMPYLGVPIAHPIERWHPYTDRRLLEFSLRLPPELKWEDEQTNYFLAARKHHRQVMKEIVPLAVLTNNGGVDFAPVLQRSLGECDVPAWVRQTKAVQVVELGFVEPNQFAQMLRQETAFPGDFRAILCLEAWLRALLPGGAFQRLLPTRRSN